MKNFRFVLLATTAIAAISIAQPVSAEPGSSVRVAQAAPDRKEAPQPRGERRTPPPKEAPRAAPPAAPAAPKAAPPAAGAPARPAAPERPAAPRTAPPAPPKAEAPARPRAEPPSRPGARPDRQAPGAAPARGAPTPPATAPAGRKEAPAERRPDTERRPDNAPKSAPVPGSPKAAPGIRDVTPQRPGPGTGPGATPTRPGTPPATAPQTTPQTAPKAAPNAVTTPPGGRPLPGTAPSAPAPNAAPPSGAAAPGAPDRGPRSERRAPPPGMPAGTPVAPAAAPAAAPLPAAPAIEAAPIPANDAARHRGGRMEDFRNQRQQTTEGGRTVIREPGRVIVQDPNGQSFIRHNDVDRFRRGARDVKVSRQGSNSQTIVVRPDGTQIITLNAPDGSLLRRVRRDSRGHEIVIIDNSRHHGARGAGGFFVALPPPVLRIPQDRYIVNAAGATAALIFDTLMAPPVDRLERGYSLEEIRYSPSVRQRMPSIDLDTINFETGSWDISDDQAAKLEVIADAMNRAIAKNPAEVFLIEGHTDAVGADVDNLSLSDRRAEAAAELLTQYFQVPPENLAAQGYGEQYLKIQTEAAERQNRRVTIRRITPLLNGQS